MKQIDRYGERETDDKRRNKPADNNRRRLKPKQDIDYRQYANRDYKEILAEVIAGENED